jgi:hypothetical protein
MNRITNLGEKAVKKLPIGIQSFREIIEGDYVYVDKTRVIHELITSGKYFFISRPRRFGKSLLLNTIKEIFLGNRELFKGLDIYDKIGWEKHPVILVDFSVIAHSDRGTLQKSLLTFINGIAKMNNIELTKEFIPDRFGELLEELSRVSGSKIVVLIDEYDKPIIDHVESREKAEENRDVLREFYGVLKYADPYLKLVLVTGVSKFAKVSIFSGLNNLQDITLSPRFATIAGYTQSELKNYFKGYIETLLAEEGISKGVLLEKIAQWYNGYSWDGVNKVYNPFSILNLFSDNRFGNYWFATGTPTFLIKLIKEMGAESPEFENKQITEIVLDSYDLDHMNLYALLFQTGYLTIAGVRKEDGLTQFTLNYPNFEVKASLLTFILEGISNNRLDEIQPATMRIKSFLREGDLEGFMRMIKAMFAKIPFTLYLEKEAYYHSIFYLILSLAGVKIDLEVLTDRGRIDGVLEFQDRVYVIEFKYGNEGASMEKLLDQAVGQIKSRRYYEKFLDNGRKILLLGVGFVGKEIGYRCQEV